MENGFVKVAAATPKLKVANCDYNKDEICKLISLVNEKEVKLVVFPELSITGYTCGDLFFQKALLDSSMVALEDIVNFSKDIEMITVVGAPIIKNDNLYNCAVVIFMGKILGVVPKSFIPNYGEFYEKRHFYKAPEENQEIEIANQKIPFGTKLIFKDKEMQNFSFSIEICEDLWAPIPPSCYHALNGAKIIANLSASDELIGKTEYRRNLIESQSARLNCGYIYADAGNGESTTDMVFAGHNIIAENGSILKESELFKDEIIVTEIDVERIEHERRRITSFVGEASNEYQEVFFNLGIKGTKLTRKFSTFPFVPNEKENRERRCNEILNIQAYGLTKRLEHIHSSKTVLGLSGGLDSCLALLVVVKAMKLMGKPLSDIITVTMPCFGTSTRTKSNAEKLAAALGTTLKVIDISNTVNSHLKDIDHPDNCYDIAYENAQARERTQVLMDIANQSNAIVIGTGDLSEMALGWSTYNGDHMSMYAVNCSVPKTLIKYIVEYFANSEISSDEIKDVLMDILDTPISPELLPGKEIKQKTEEIVGPYELHDFFLYYIVRWGMEPAKLYRIAKYTFEGRYDSETILKWLKSFYKRFFNNQFKRSCIPDGPKVGSVALSPRGDWRMPSDACYDVWWKKFEKIDKNS